MLASEALKDDVAPLHPLSTLLRVCGLATGGLMAFLAVAPPAAPALAPNPSHQLLTHLPLALLALLAGGLRWPYAARAAALLVVAVGVSALGALGLGPGAALASAVTTGAPAPLHALAIIVLPAALLFRAIYRAYPGARWLLALAILLAAPCAVLEAPRLLSAWDLPVQLAHGAALLAMSLAFLGFMGEETTGAGMTGAVAIVVTETASLGSDLVWPATAAAQSAGLTSALLSMLAFGLSGLLGALGLFGLLALWLGPRARVTNSRGRPGPRRAEQASIGGWLSRR